MEGAPLLHGASTSPTSVSNWLFIEVRCSIETRRANMGTWWKEVLPKERGVGGLTPQWWWMSLSRMRREQVCGEEGHWLRWSFIQLWAVYLWWNWGWDPRWNKASHLDAIKADSCTVVLLLINLLSFHVKVLFAGTEKWFESSGCWKWLESTYATNLPSSFKSNGAIFIFNVCAQWTRTWGCWY